MSFGNDVALIVPTRNRAMFVRRLLTYLVVERFGGAIVVADSSDDEDFSKTQRLTEQLNPTFDLTHLACPNMNAPQATVTAFDSVDAGFATLLPDDDFIYPPSMDTCTRFLADHPDYSVAVGRSCIFSGVDASAYGTITDLTTYTIHPLEQDTAADRLIAHFQRYSVNTFGIHRTPELRDAFEAGRDIPVMHFAGELLPGALHAVSGKVALLDELFLIRQQHSARYRAESSVIEWMTNPQWSGALATFQKKVAQRLIAVDRIDEEDARRIAARAFAEYLVAQFAKRDLADPLARNVFSGFFRTFLGRHPALKRILKSARAVVRGENDRLSLQNSGKASSPYHQAFSSVTRIVSGVNLDADCVLVSADADVGQTRTEVGF